MERYGSDTEGDDTPLLHRGHEDKVQRGEAKTSEANEANLANNNAACRRGSFRVTAALLFAVLSEEKQGKQHLFNIISLFNVFACWQPFVYSARTPRTPAKYVTEAPKTFLRDN